MKFSFVAICNPQCLNGGTCILPYLCFCPPGIYGHFCEKCKTDDNVQCHRHHGFTKMQNHIDHHRHNHCHCHHNLLHFSSVINISKRLRLSLVKRSIVTEAAL